jgi:hypothetical protein
MCRGRPCRGAEAGLRCHAGASAAVLSREHCIGTRFVELPGSMFSGCDGLILMIWTV